MDEKIKSLLQGKLTRPIGEIYTARAKDSINPKSIVSEKQTVYGEQEDVSSASEDEKVDRLPQKRIETRKFRKQVMGEHLSWIGAAQEGGIQVRGHTSGTGPLTMSAIDGLCASGTNPDTWLATDKNFKTLAGALIISTCQRGDYHSIAETTAGINHYLNERAITLGKTRQNEPVHPYDAFCEGLSLLCDACTTSELEDTDELGLQEAVSLKCKDIEQKVTRVEAKMKEFDARNPEAFYITAQTANKFIDYKQRFKSEIERSTPEPIKKEAPEVNEQQSYKL